MLRISIHEDEKELGFTLEGRVAGPWVDELRRAWKDVADKIDGRRVWLNLRDVTYTDASGKQTLQEIFQQSRAELMTSSPWSQYLADEVRGNH